MRQVGGVFDFAGIDERHCGGRSPVRRTTAPWTDPRIARERAEEACVSGRVRGSRLGSPVHPRKKEPHEHSGSFFQIQAPISPVWLHYRVAPAAKRRRTALASTA